MRFYNLTIIYNNIWFTRRYSLTLATALLVAESYLSRGFTAQIVEA